MATLYRRLREAKSPLSYSEEDVSDDRKRTLAEISAELFDDRKREIFREHVVEHPVTQGVIDGEKTFYQLGAPIVEHCKLIEETVANRKFAYVGKDRILGVDPRDSAQVKEVVDYLRNEGIINPAEFFSSQRIFPQIVSGAAKRAEEFFNRHRGKTILTGIASASAGGIYFWFNPAIQISNDEIFNRTINGLDGYFAGAFLAIGPQFAISYLQSVNKLTEQRQKFEEALRYMDDEARRLFHVQEKAGELEKVVA